MIGRSVDSSRTRSVGSRATATASSKAQSTALGWNRQTGGIISNAFATKKMSTSAIRGGIHRGSPAGFKGHRSAYIAPEGTGYDNPSLSKARYKKTQLALPKVSMVQYKGMKTARVFDNRIAKSVNGASSRLLKRLI